MPPLLSATIPYQLVADPQTQVPLESSHSPLSNGTWVGLFASKRSLFRYVFNDVEQCLTTALFTACADGGSESPPPLDFCKTRLWQVMDASIDLRDPNPN